MTLSIVNRVYALVGEIKFVLLLAADGGCERVVVHRVNEGYRA